MKKIKPKNNANKCVSTKKEKTVFNPIKVVINTAPTNITKV